MISSLRHVGLVVQDLEYSIKFWTNALGFKIEKQMKEKGSYLDKVLSLKNVNVTTVKLSAPNGGIIELLKFHSHKDKLKWDGKAYSTGLTHIALEVINVNLVYNNLIKSGVKFFDKPQNSPDGYAKLVFGQGPENVLIEFVEILSK